MSHVNNVKDVEIRGIGHGVATAIHGRQPPHMQTSVGYSHEAKQAVVPSSWGIGTFHQNNPIFNQRVVSASDARVPRGVSSRQQRPMTTTNIDRVGGEPSPTKARIDPSSRVADEDYFRAIKEHKIMKQLQKKQTERTMARTRFEEDKAVPVGAKAVLDGANPDNIELVPASAFQNMNPHTIRFVDPNLTERQAIKRIQLPAKTMYLIDKVVRAKALRGPIGVDNSEVINLEQEKELKKRDQYYANLADKRSSKQTGDSDDDEYLSEDEMNMDDQERENVANEKLLKRLYKAAQADIDAQEAGDETAQAQVHFRDDEDPNSESKLGAQDKSMLDLHRKEEAQLAKAQINHDHWLRIKEHQERLRSVLVFEAKKDLFEKMILEQAALDKENQERAHRMFEWEERKLVTEALKKQQELREKETERLVKVNKQEKGYFAFKDWLKTSLEKQQRETYHKKIEEHEKRCLDEEAKKAKESMKIMARIAYKEWKERKTEESRHKKKVEKMEKRRQKMEEQEIKMARRQMVMEMQTRQGGGGQILLAYGLNKNLKQLDMANKNRAKSARPRRSKQQHYQ